jgi:hypothetical protein
VHSSHTVVNPCADTAFWLWLQVGGFIGGVLTGRNRIVKLPAESGVPVISSDDNCTATHEAMMPIEEDELDMGDILEEIQAEAAEKEEKESAMADAENDLVDAEMDAKRKRAEAEAARMSKASNKGLKKKKKKKKKTKKKKEEL